MVPAVIKVETVGCNFGVQGVVRRGDQVLAETRFYPQGYGRQAYTDAAERARALGLCCGYQVGNLVRALGGVGIVTKLRPKRNMVQVMIVGTSGPAWTYAQSVSWASKS